MAAYMALMKPGDTMLSLDLNSGGHLTHGASFNFSGKQYKVVHYGLTKETETIDYAQAAALAKEHKPRVIVVGASAYPRIIDFPRFRAIADSVGAALMVDMAHIAGLVAGGVHPSPIPYADIVTTTTHKTLRGPRGGPDSDEGAVREDGQQPGVPRHSGRAADARHRGQGRRVPRGAAAVVQGLRAAGREERAGARRRAQGQGLRLVSGGTDNHLMLLDLRPKKVTGKLGEEVLGQAGITVNKNQIPFDPEKPTVSSGVRVGTPALTTRGMKEADMATVATLIGKALDHASDDAVLAKVRGEVNELTQSFPLYRSRLKQGLTPHAVPILPGVADTRVMDSRDSAEGTIIRRRRECETCKRRFTTYERVEELNPLVVKKDGRREAFDRDKLLAGSQEGLREAAGVGRPGRAARHRDRAQAAGDGREGSHLDHHRRDGDGAAAGARRGGLRALRVGVPELPRHRRVHGRAEGHPRRGSRRRGAEKKGGAGDRRRARHGAGARRGREGLGRTHPNPAVGAVIVKGGQGDRQRLSPSRRRRRTPRPWRWPGGGEGAKGATLYSTLEPCNHHGRTPPVHRGDHRGRHRAGGLRLDRPQPAGRTARARPPRAAGVEVVGRCSRPTPMRSTARSSRSCAPACRG